MTNLPDIATLYAYMYQREVVGLSAENMITIEYPDAAFYEELYQDKDKQELYVMEAVET